MRGDSHPKPSFEDLLARARAGDEGALEALFARSKPLIEKWVARRRHKKQPGISRPSDLAQDASFRAFKSFATFEGTTEKQWGAWLESVFDSCTTQAFRDAGRKKRDTKAETPLDDPSELDVPSPQVSPSQATANEEQWQQVFTQIFQLPEDQKQAIWLCHLKETRVAEAARQMGKSEGAVAGLLQRGLKTLREQFADDAGRKSSASAAPSPGQEEAVAALLTYLRRRDAGQHVEAAAFVAEHPACADELRAMLEWIERIHAIRPTNLDGE